MKEEKDTQEATLKQQIVDLQKEFDLEKAEIFFEKSETAQKYKDEIE